MLVIDLECLLPFCLLFIFLLSMGWHYGAGARGAGVFTLIGCK